MILSHARLPIPTLPLTQPSQTAELMADSILEGPSTPLWAPVSKKSGAFGDPPRGRTENLRIKSPLLCQLS